MGRSIGPRCKEGETVTVNLGNMKCPRCFRVVELLFKDNVFPVEGQKVHYQVHCPLKSTHGYQCNHQVVVGTC